jgi:DNA-3-methyladenine glycosylase
MHDWVHFHKFKIIRQKNLPSPRMKLSPGYYQQPDTLGLARDLLGKVLVTRIDGHVTSGMIVETEAYLGTSDRACHAYGGRRTSRTEVMYARGGVAYVYLCYGIHHLFNVVTHLAGEPHAILIRGIEPLDGIATMLARRGATTLKPTLTAGPGALTQALGISTAHTGLSLCSDAVYLEDRGVGFADNLVMRSPRVGVGYAKEDALLPYRLRVLGSPWTSPAR